ncbi:MAG: hypothetical protein VR73_06850 [Gammaproteobacteria bacterium BRH_c0]|nr:MAG: hypothetical protein VR73_06850 [Gammaproteobacteria bacterium BRH_c0]
MNRDYAKPSRRPNKARNTRHQPTRKTAPGWLWLVAGALVGALVMNLVLQIDRQEAEPSVAEEPPLEEDNDTMPKPRFDFYTLLKESEVIIADETDIPATPVEMPKPTPVPEADTENIRVADTAKTPKPETQMPSVAAATAPPPAADVTAKADNAKPATPAETEKAPAPPPQPSPPKEVYLLQAGAFKSANDAENLRVKLLFLNVQAKVETVSPRPGETWHRVQVGPFSNTQSLGDARTVLQQNGIPSIQVKKTL